MNKLVAWTAALAAAVGISFGAVVVDPSLEREARKYPLHRSADGQPRHAAVARFPNGLIVPFVENELLITSNDPAAAEALAVRYGGRIVKAVVRPRESRRGTTYAVRVNTDQAPANAFGRAENGVAFSSAAARNLLAIAVAERKAGRRLGVNLIPQDTGLFEKKTVEGGGVDALSFPYMQTGGALDVDVAGAWKALFQAGKTGSKSIRIGIVDEGFDMPRSDSSSATSTWPRRTKRAARTRPVNGTARTWRSRRPASRTTNAALPVRQRRSRRSSPPREAMT